MLFNLLVNSLPPDLQWKRRNIEMISLSAFVCREVEEPEELVFPLLPNSHHTTKSTTPDIQCYSHCHHLQLHLFLPSPLSCLFPSFPIFLSKFSN